MNVYKFISFISRRTCLVIGKKPRHGVEETIVGVEETMAFCGRNYLTQAV
jgi:hypothetical protein